MEPELEFAIVPVVSYVLNQLVARNDRLPFTKADATIFHGLKPPAITVRSYLDRIVKYSPCSPECFVLALVYVDRIIQRNTKFVITSLNVHRLLITSIMTAVKYFDDCSYNNAYYAKVGGIPLAELNALEIELLFLLNFNLNVSADVFARYHAELLKHVSKASAADAAAAQQEHIKAAQQQAAAHMAVSTVTTSAAVCTATSSQADSAHQHQHVEMVY